MMTPLNELDSSAQKKLRVRSIFKAPAVSLIFLIFYILTTDDAQLFVRTGLLELVGGKECH